MKKITLRHANPQQDFALIAEWFTILDGAVNTEKSLQDYYERSAWRIHEKLAEDEGGQPVAFYWVIRDEFKPERAYLNLFVKQEERCQGIGNRLMAECIADAIAFGSTILQSNVLDTDLDFKHFAQKHGFEEKRHSIGMHLDLTRWDDSVYDELISRLLSQGMEFTSMQALGNTEEAQRKLYHLNDCAGLDIPHTEKEHIWDTFEDFQKSVCQQPWYNPAGQKVVIDHATGEFVAMSAVSAEEGSSSAYNLFTGVERKYRGRSLGLAVKATALRFARDEMHAVEVYTHHNDENDPMIHIDRKLGYTQSPGVIVMEKILDQEEVYS